MLVERFAAFLHRRRVLLLAAWVAHALLIHWFLLGYVSWDGLAYRVPPIVDLVQHGSFGMERYYQWAYAGYLPFVELAHAPFLYVFKLPGLLISFPVFVFPACVAAVYLFVRELTGDPRAGTFGALAYAAIPMVNQQPYSGYVDFAVCGLLALWLYAILRTRNTPRRVFAFTRVAGATMLFTMSRTQGIYVAAMILPILVYAIFATRSGLRIKITKPKELAIAIAGTIAGGIPIISIQVMKFLRYGTPTYPYQFQVLGLKIGNGFSTHDLFAYAGLVNETPIEFWRAFAGGWIWPRYWPLGGFFDSRNMGGGFVLIVALALLIVFVRAASKAELLLVGACLLVSLTARDFFLPRYAYTFIIALCAVIGRAMSRLSTGTDKTARPLFWASAVALLLHMLRPEAELAMLDLGIGPRVNVTRSPLFRPGPDTMEVMKDLDTKLVIVEYNQRLFTLPLYGTRLTNEVMTTVPKGEIGEGCSRLLSIVDKNPKVLFIDDSNHTRECERECAATAPNGACQAYRLKVPRAPEGS